MRECLAVLYVGLLAGSGLAQDASFVPLGIPADATGSAGRAISGDGLTAAGYLQTAEGLVSFR